MVLCFSSQPIQSSWGNVTFNHFCLLLPNFSPPFSNCCLLHLMVAVKFQQFAISTICFSKIIPNNYKTVWRVLEKVSLINGAFGNESTQWQSWNLTHRRWQWSLLVNSQGWRWGWGASWFLNPLCCPSWRQEWHLLFSSHQALLPVIMINQRLLTVAWMASACSLNVMVLASFFSCQGWD